MVCAQSLMNPQPLSDDVVKGFSTRQGQLRAWARHARKRLGKIRGDAPRIGASGARKLLRRGHEFLDWAEQAAEAVGGFLASPTFDIANLDRFRNRVFLPLQVVEACVRAVDQKILPVLSSRTPSDPKYDDFITRFLSDLNLKHFSPVTSHKQHDVLGLASDSAFREPIFFFSPSIRSLDALSLLYHEIGHIFYNYVVSKDRELHRPFMRRMLPLASNWIACTQDQGVVANELSLRGIEECFPSLWRRRGEIAADAFAGLVGGHSYTSSLCNLFLLKGSPHTWKSPEHPPAAWRVWFSRRASRNGGSLDEDDSGPSFAAWEAALNLPENPATEAAPKPDDQPDKPELVNDDNAASGFLSHFSDVLETYYNVPLAGGTRRPKNWPPKLNWKQATVPEILLAGSKWRQRSDWEDYCGWERSIFPEINL